MASRGALEAAPVALALCRQLAIGELNVAELATWHSVSRQAVRDFGRRHHQRVLEVRRALDDVYAGITYADKRARVAALSQQVEDVIELLADPATAARAGVQRAEMERVIQTGLRAIADELGQIPQKMQVEVGGSFAININGVDISDLR